MYFRSQNELGCHCHWCGEIVPDDGHVKKGKHLYCRNGGRCKMAHKRAFDAYEARVTSRAAAAPGLVAHVGPNGNGKRSAGGRTSSAEISLPRSAKSNAKKVRSVGRRVIE